MSLLKRLKTAQLSLRIDQGLKEVADKAVSADHKSLTSLIELTDCIWTKSYLSAAGGGRPS